VAVALLLGACAANSNPPSTPVQAGGAFTTEVPDSVNDVGRVPSVGVDAQGNPQIAYLLLTAKLAKGDIPPPVIAGQPQPPAVLLASTKDGIWTRTSVTKQETSPAKGSADGISFKDGTAGPVVHTGLVVDAQGKHHVAWSAATGLYYNDDAAGGFGDPQQVAQGETFGAAIALGPDGSAWISYYQANALMVAHQEGTAWKTETVQGTVSGAGDPSRVTAIGVGSSGDPMIAFGDGDATKLARRSGTGWTAETVPGGGGYGVSLAVDKDGNPHLAYYDPQGTVHHAHSVGGGTWDVNALGTTKPAPGGDPAWGTGIAVDDQGIHDVAWADPRGDRIVFSTNQAGQFASQTIPTSGGGQTPSVAVTPDGKHLVIGWYDSVNQNLVVATNTPGQSIAFSPPPIQATASPTGGAATCKPSGTTVKVAAKNIAFDTDCLAAPAGKAFTVDFDNQDSGVPHNLEIFTDSSATQRLGGAKDATDIVVGPGQATYDVSALDKGTFFFRCDIHPTQMTGTFVVG